MTMLSKHNAIQRIKKETRAYQERLQEEINQDREEHGRSHGVSSIMMDSKRFTILYSGFKSNEKPKKGFGMITFRTLLSTN